MTQFVKWGSLFFPLILLMSCGSAPSQRSDDSGLPVWTHQPTRTVDNGYIVYVGLGEDRAPEKAAFKAESMALQDLANECSFAPKGTRVEDRFDQTVGILHRAYAKVAVEFQDCERAKSAVTPAEIRQLASPELTAEINRYQEVVDQPEPAENAPLEVASADEGASNRSISSGNTAIIVRDRPSFFIVRERVALVKEEVILAPASRYPAQATRTVQPIPSVQVAGQQVRQYEMNHSEIRSGHLAFSRQRPHWYEHQAPALRESRAERFHIQRAYAPAEPLRRVRRVRRRRARRWRRW